MKTFKIAPTCFDPKTIVRELHCSMLKSHLRKSLINLLLLTWCYDSMSQCVSRTPLTMRLTHMCIVCYAAWDSVKNCVLGLTRLSCSLCRYSCKPLIPWIRLNIISTFFCFLRGIINLNRQLFLWPLWLYFISCTYLVREIVFPAFIS